MELEKIEVRNLPELKGWKEKMELAVKENPFVEITDNATYQEAKKNRTALVTARTDVQKQDKIIASKLKDIRQQAADVANELISITEPHETKQQEEVKRYEAEKEAERQEKERQERERIDKIKATLNGAEVKYNSLLREMTYENSEKTISEYEESKKLTSENFDFEEFSPLFDSLVSRFDVSFEERAEELRRGEELRIENEKLKREAEEARKKAEAERERLEVEKRKMEEERMAERAEQIKKELEERQKREELQKKLDALEEEKRQEDEKERLLKEEQERKNEEAKKLAEDKKRQKRLSKDKEKAKLFVLSWQTEVDSSMENAEMTELINEFVSEFDFLQNQYLKKIENL